LNKWATLFRLEDCEEAILPQPDFDGLTPLALQENIPRGG